MILKVIDLVSDKISFLIQNGDKITDLNGIPFNTPNGKKITDKKNRLYYIIGNINPPAPPFFYSNFEQYIVNGTRATTGVIAGTIRVNVSIIRELIVTETIIINGFNIMRVPPSNWSSIQNYNIIGTLSVIGDGATINGSTNSLQLLTNEIILNPDTVDQRLTPDLTHYDIYKLRPNNTSITLTAGRYNLSIIGSSGTGNFGMALLLNANYPIDTTKKIYPSPTAATQHLVMQVV